MVALFRSGLSIREVSRRTGVHFSTVRYHLIKSGVFRVRHKRVQDDRAFCKRCRRRESVNEFPALQCGKYLCRECLVSANHAVTIRKLGCTSEQYQKLVELQNGKCAICGTVEGHRSRYGKRCKLSVDHDHTNGIVRGLLCNNCNRGLGRFKDSVSHLEAAVRYLKREQ